MRILLPPSAGKTTKESTNHLQLEKLWQAEHLTQTRRQLIDDVQNTALLADAAQIFKLGPKNAHEISQNLEIYDALALAVLSARTVAKNLRKLSCLIKHAVIKLPSRERRGVINF